ncbi:MAG TPA: hypothetical protein DCP32_01985 [Anaerolineaceae bacterium]|nr:hypothetical protein [Anaerolineaceae bacterium]
MRAAHKAYVISTQQGSTGGDFTDILVAAAGTDDEQRSGFGVVTNPFQVFEAKRQGIEMRSRAVIPPAQHPVGAQTEHIHFRVRTARHKQHIITVGQVLGVAAGAAEQGHRADFGHRVVCRTVNVVCAQVDLINFFAVIIRHKDAIIVGIDRDPGWLA